MGLKKRIALDTNVAVAFLNGDEAVKNALTEYEEICLPVTVCGELLFGAQNSKRKQENIENFKAFIDACTVLEAGKKAADLYAKLRKALKDKGKPIPENDIWIAALCQEHKVTLATRDKHFSFLPDLETIHL